MKIGAVLLAAGLSSRMKACKPLLMLGNHSLLGHCATLFGNAGCEPILTIVGHQAEKTAEAARHLGLKPVNNARFHDGMFSSVQAGVRALGRECDGFFLLPVDIPLVRPVTIGALLKAFAASPDQVIVPRFDNNPGHPPLIPARLIPEILDYSGGGGLQALLARHSRRQIEVWDQGILMDADTREDLAVLADRVDRLSVPTPAEAEVLARMLVPSEGIRHGQLVAKAALVMAEALTGRGRMLDRDLIYAGGLLHDLAKGEKNHGLRAAVVLNELGLSPVAMVAADHCDLAPPDNGVLSETHLVCLADKVVGGTRLMDLKERYRQKLLRYRADDEVRAIIDLRMQRGLALQHLFEMHAGCSLIGLLRGAGL